MNPFALREPPGTQKRRDPLSPRPSCSRETIEEELLALQFVCCLKSESSLLLQLRKGKEMPDLDQPKEPGLVGQGTTCRFKMKKQGEGDHRERRGRSGDTAFVL